MFVNRKCVIVKIILLASIARILEWKWGVPKSRLQEAIGWMVLLRNYDNLNAVFNSRTKAPNVALTNPLGKGI